MKYVPPSVRETAFNCPHCGALAKQFWYSLSAKEREESSETPRIIDKAEAEEFETTIIEDEDFRRNLFTWYHKMASGMPFIERQASEFRVSHELYNLHASSCYNCDEISVWIYDKLLFPVAGEAPPANPDMPEFIRQDYIEASTILNLSPRGAAALLRLAIQKLCKELGQSGKNINDDIGALVKLGLDSRVQQALDVVRVIGNNAIHPGQIDIKDDRSTAEALFRLLNLVVEKTISEPKHIAELYASLPEDAVRAIERRDKK